MAPESKHPRLISVAVTGQDFDDDDDDDESASSEQPWHNRTPAVLGASALGLVVIAILVLAVSYRDSSVQRAGAGAAELRRSHVLGDADRIDVARWPPPPRPPPARAFRRPQTSLLPPPPSSSSETSSDETTSRRTTTTTTTPTSPARPAADRARMSRARSNRSPLSRLLSVPVARYGPPDDPNYPDDSPTAYLRPATGPAAR